jgi:sugar lactone lactonase YvrE
MLTSCFERPRGVAVSAFVLVLTVFGLVASPAFAFQQTFTYTTPGTYTVAVPQYATSLSILADGAGGTPGGDTPAEATGGGGGGGAQVNLTVPVAGGSFPAGGDTLQLIVGAQGGGGPGGVGSEAASGGGAGGGATVLSDLSSSQTSVIVVASGGGGGGGAGAFASYDGGSGGFAYGAVFPTSGGPTSGGPAPITGAAGGNGGPYVTVGCGTTFSVGTAGEAAATPTDAGGGGGGGDGGPGVNGAGGDAGGVGGGGGGGGGAGGSCILPGSTNNAPVSAGFQSDGAATLTFTVTATPIQITSPNSLSVPSTARTVLFPVIATGSPAPSLSLSGAPSWLTITNSGFLEGAIPPHTVATYTFDINADNGQSNPAGQVFTLHVTAPPLAQMAPTSVTGTVGSPLSVRLNAGGGSGPYTWSLAPGTTLPTGLSLSSDGVISGTPTAASTATPILQITDSAVPNAESSRGSVAIKINARKLIITPLSLPKAVVGKPYSQTLTGAMGTAPVTWKIVSGSLPAGLSLGARTGTISGTPTAPGTSTFKVQATDSSTPTRMTATSTLTLIVNPGVAAAVFVTDAGYSAVQSFALGATGNVAPLTSITSSALDGTSAVAIDASGTVYVANSLSNAITEFGYGANGNVTPTTTIGGPATGLSYPSGLTIDSSGRLYVANYLGNTITVYAPGASRNATPIATISGANTGLVGPYGLAVDNSGNLWVANLSNDTLASYPAGANGNVTPTATIGGTETGLGWPSAITIDGRGNLLVANPSGAALTEYAPSDNGNVAPLRTISGSATEMSYPEGVDVDSQGNIYVANGQGGVTEYAPGATGNAAPIADIQGSATLLLGAVKLAVAPPLSVRTTKLRAAFAHRRYRATLRAYLGTTPYRWRLIRGQLPPGVRLGIGGVLSGRPGRAGTYHFTVGLRDHSRHTMTATALLEMVVRSRKR